MSAADTLIAQLKENPGDEVLRGICADAMEEGGYEDLHVLDALRGRDVPEEERDFVRTQLRALFGCVQAHCITPAHWHHERLRSTAALLQNPDTTFEQMSEFLQKENPRILVVNSARHEWRELLAIAALRFKIVMFWLNLTNIHDPSLISELVQIVAESGDPRAILDALRVVTDKVHQETLVSALLALNNVLFDEFALHYVTDPVLRARLQRVCAPMD